VKPVVPSNGRPRRPRRRSAAVALCAVLLAGCGGSSDSAEPRPTPDATSPTVTTPNLPTDMAQRPACGVVTRAEVEAAIGARVTPGQETVEEARSMCIFNVGAGAEERVGVVAVTSSGVPAFFASARDRLTSPQRVSAGDEAFVSGGQAVVRRGNTMVAIVVALRRDPPQLTAISTRLAQAVGTHI
jgi:hypothetical protein